MLILATIVACSKGGDSKTIKVENSYSEEYAEDSLTEKLRDFVELEEGDYKLTKNGSELDLTLKFESEIISNDDEEKKREAAMLSNCKLVVVLLDEDETELSDGELNLTGATMKQVIDWAMSTDVNSVKEFKFTKFMGSEELLKKASRIKVYVKSNEAAAIQEAPAIESEDSSDISNDDEIVKDASDVDFDELLANYEEYYTEYINTMKKAVNGDMTAITECQELMEKAQELSDKLEKFNDDMTPAQIAKFERVQMKLLKAAQELDN